jgi:hypothetical protein
VSVGKGQNVWNWRLDILKWVEERRQNGIENTRIMIHTHSLKLSHYRDIYDFRDGATWCCRFMRSNCSVGRISRTLFLTRDSPSSLLDGLCWGSRLATLLLIRTNLGYGTVITAACTRQGFSAADDDDDYYYYYLLVVCVYSLKPNLLRKCH